MNIKKIVFSVLMIGVVSTDAMAEGIPTEIEEVVFKVGKMVGLMVALPVTAIFHNKYAVKVDSMGKTSKAIVAAVVGCAVGVVVEVATVYAGFVLLKLHDKFKK
jgi:hypothetical protein